MGKCSPVLLSARAPTAGCKGVIRSTFSMTLTTVNPDEIRSMVCGSNQQKMLKRKVDKSCHKG